MKLQRDELKDLMKGKFVKAGLVPEHAERMAEVLTWADERGYHSHGAVRVEYYSERIAKGGMTVEPSFTFTQTGPCSAVYDGDNGCGYVVATNAMNEAIRMARENGIAVVGVRRMSHTGSIGYYVEMAAQAGLIGLTMCQSDPMAIPYGGIEPFYGTNPIAFGAPTADERTVIFDMATTVQAWGKILDARSRKAPIPEDWAVDAEGRPTTDPFAVNALVPIAGAKGYGLMLMVDVLSGILTGVPFGGHVSSMYADLSKGRELGQLHIVIDPGRFIPIDEFRRSMSACLDELAAAPTSEGFEKVYYPGERSLLRKARYEEAGGIEIVDDVYEYLISDDVHRDRYDHRNRFAE
jgi:ureidoglycolate dehydrogenase (NAD+)